MAWLGLDVGTLAHRWTFSRLLVLGAIVLGPSACKSSASETTKAAPSGATPSTAGANKVVTREDCDTWAQRGAKIVMTTVEGATAACPPDKGDAIRKQFADRTSAFRSAGESLCASHMGDAYSVADAACFVNATDAIGMQSCKFAPMLGADDTDWAVIVKSMKDRCAGRTAPSAAPAPSGAPGGTNL